MSFKSKLFTLISSTREDVRQEVVIKFLDETCGSGTGDLASKYEYTVESYYNEYTVVLKRPASLNNGFDFQVVTPEIYYNIDNGRRHNHPSHKDVETILNQVKWNYPQKYQVISELIKSIFLCEECEITKAGGLFFFDGDDIKRPLPIFLLALRCLFIEQDITYWNNSGRQMLMNQLKEIGLVED